MVAIPLSIVHAGESSRSPCRTRKVCARTHARMHACAHCNNVRLPQGALARPKPPSSPCCAAPARCGH